VQITRTTPLRRITLHFTQIFFTEARTFIGRSSRCELSYRSEAAPRTAASRNSGWGHPGSRKSAAI